MQHPYKSYIKRRTCNTIDDVTGEIVKLDETSTRWDYAQVTWLNFEPRQPQDFPGYPVPPKVYNEARSDIIEPPVPPFNPNNGWGFGP